MKRILEEAKRLIGTRSLGETGNEEIASYAAGLSKERGFKVQLQQVTHSLENVSKRQFNVIGVLGDPLVDRKTRKGLLLTAHLDTPDPGRLDNWDQLDRNPRGMKIDGDQIFGLGSADAKLDFLCKLYAALRFRDKKLKMPIYLVGTCGNDLGLLGARYLIESYALNPKYVLVGAPTRLRLVNEQKQQFSFRVRVKYQQVERDAKGFNRRIRVHSYGKVSHGAFPAMGCNAIEQLLDLLKLTTENGFDIKVTEIKGGRAVNQVPDEASVDFYLNSHQFEDFKRFYLEKFHGEENESFQVELGGLGDMGVRFLPDSVFKTVLDLNTFFRSLKKQFDESEDIRFEPATSTMNLGTIEQSHSEVDLYYEARLIPEHSLEEVREKIQWGMDEVSAKFPNLNVELDIEQVNESFRADETGELAILARNALSESGTAPEMTTSSITTEASLYAREGFDALAFGPGANIGMSHCPNEANQLSQLESGVAFYQKLIEKACL